MFVLLKKIMEIMSGIKAGDKILKVDGKVVSAQNSDEAITMIKGKKGTEVELT